MYIFKIRILETFKKNSIFYKIKGKFYHVYSYQNVKQIIFLKSVDIKKKLIILGLKILKF